MPPAPNTCSWAPSITPTPSRHTAGRRFPTLLPVCSPGHPQWHEHVCKRLDVMERRLKLSLGPAVMAGYQGESPSESAPGCPHLVSWVTLGSSGLLGGNPASCPGSPSGPFSPKHPPLGPHPRKPPQVASFTRALRDPSVHRVDGLSFSPQQPCPQGLAFHHKEFIHLFLQTKELLCL